MNIIRHTVNVYCWIVTCLSLFLLIALGLFFALFFPIKKINPYLKRPFRLFFRLIFCPVAVEGLEKLSPDKSYLYIPNHVSFFDPFLFVAYLPGFVRGVETTKHFRWPVYGHFIRVFGNVPIDQSNVRASLQSLSAASQLMKQGMSMILFPEGTRTPDGRVAPFKRLPFIMAKETDADIVPVGLIGLFNVFPKGSRIITPSRITIRIGDPIPYHKVAAMDTRALQELIYSQVVDLATP